MMPLIASIACYIAAFSLQYKRLKSRSEDNNRVILGITAVGVLFHAIALFQTMIIGDTVDFGFFKISSMIALFFTLFLILSALNKPVDNLLIALLPVSILALILAQFLPETFTPKQYSNGMLAHIIISILAYSIMTISATHAVLIIILDNKLKSHHPGGMVWGLPPLLSMERLLWDMLVLGMIGLSLAIITGAIYIEDLFAQHLIHKTVLTILSWFVFAILLIGHVKMGWRGKVAAKWTIGGFAILLIAFMGSKFVLEVLL